MHISLKGGRIRLSCRACATYPEHVSRRWHCSRHMCMHICSHLIYIYIYIYIHIYIYIERERDTSSCGFCCRACAIFGGAKGVWEAGGIRLETSSNFCGSKKHIAYVCVKNRGVRFHRIRDFKQYYLNSIPPTSHHWRAEGPDSSSRDIPKRVSKNPEMNRSGPIRGAAPWSDSEEAGAEDAHLRGSAMPVRCALHQTGSQKGSTLNTTDGAGPRQRRLVSRKLCETSARCQ